MRETLLVMDMVMIAAAAVLQLRNIIKYKKTNGALRTRITFVVLWVTMFIHCFAVYNHRATGIFFTVGIIALLSLYFRTHHTVNDKRIYPPTPVRQP
jgi:hypothetical protein